MKIPSAINPFDIEQLKQRVAAAQPYPYFAIDNFLSAEFAETVLESFPTYGDAMKTGKSFNAVNEKGKVQLTDSKSFAPAVRELNELLASQDWLDILGYVMGIPKLLADEELVGGGMHQTGPRGHLDVHVDFNYIPERKLHRRLNILVYFNKQWEEKWGGNIELWDEKVKVCEQSLSPVFNRCVVFETNEISFHGVSAVNCPPGMSRKSFAAYYYTVDPPVGWDGTYHSTIFKARPDEVTKKLVAMPLEKMSRSISGGIRRVKDMLKKPFRS